MNFKKIFPNENYTLISLLSIEDVRRRIIKNIDPGSSEFSLPGISSTPYEGRMVNNTFQVHRVTTRTNSYLPIVTGHISSHPGQRLITLKMQLKSGVATLWSVVVGGLILFSLLFLMVALFIPGQISIREISLFILMSCMVLFVNWRLMLFVFKTESNRSKAFFVSLLDAREVKDVYENINN